MGSGRCRTRPRTLPPPCHSLPPLLVSRSSHGPTAAHHPPPRPLTTIPWPINSPSGVGAPAPPPTPCLFSTLSPLSNPSTPPRESAADITPDPPAPTAAAAAAPGPLSFAPPPPPPSPPRPSPPPHVPVQAAPPRRARRQCLRRPRHYGGGAELARWGRRGGRRRALRHGK